MRGTTTLLLTGVIVSLASAGVRAQPIPDASTITTLQLENDSLSGTDRFYTSGVRLGVTLPTGDLPQFAQNFGHWLWGDGLQRIAFDLSQNMFTPRVTQDTNPDPRDRPYAAELLGTASLIQDTDRTRNIVSLGVGAIGPPALGEEAQNAVHRVIRAKSAKGWDFQLPGQPDVQLTADRIWRVPLTSPDRPIEIDMLPEATAGAGTSRIYGQGGIQFRIGQGLDADFGAARIRPGLSGSDAFNTTRRLAWYLFAGADAQAVAWDETLNGEPFANTRHVPRSPLVGEFEVGLVVIIANDIRASFTQVWQTHEFYGQYGHLFEFSSAALSIKF
jgi:hypothetical protein